MAINFSGQTEYQNNTAVNTSPSNTQNTQQTGSVTVGSSVASGSQLSTGQVFSGEVISIDGKEIQLLLDNNQTLSAKLDGNLSAAIGQILSFEVKSTANNQTALRPLYANLTQNPAVLNALNGAGMPANKTYVSMVSAMMEEGMPVNRQALWSMAKNVNAYPDASTATLVQLTKLGLPIDELTIHQFENYKNFEHQIIKDAAALSEGLSELPAQALKEGKQELAAALTDQILTMLGTDSSADSVGKGIAEALLRGDSLLLDSGAVGTESETITKPAADALPVQGAEGTVQENGAETRAALTPQQQQFFAEKLSQLGIGEPEQKQLLSGETSVNDLLTFIKTLAAAQNGQTDTLGLSRHQQQTLQELLGSREFTSLVKEELVKQFVLNPREIAEEGKVEELYKRITEQSAKAIEILQTAGKDGGAVMKSAQNLGDNVNFMNQLNQMMTYVQLPLRMNQENTHGELYVYTNKKNLVKKDGNVSALLHLEMEHLGTMDVYVAMQNSKVSTHFYMQDEATLDFIEQHIELLNERLTKKGYQMTTTATVKERAEQQSIAKEFLKNDSGTMAPIASKLSFDVRA